MITPDIGKQLEAVAKRHRDWKLWRELAILWVALAVVGAVLLVWRPPFSLLIFLAALLAGRVFVWARNRALQTDYRWVAREVEKRHPELQTLLLAAIDQMPDPATGRLSYLQTRVISDATAQSRRGHWLDTVPEKQLIWLHRGHLGGMALAAIPGVILLVAALPGGRRADGARIARGSAVEVTPGDVELERGSPLTVLVRFPKAVSGDVTLRIGANQEASRTVPLTRNLNDPVFGTSLAAIDADTMYHVEFNGERTRDYTVKVFDFPRLERADARLVYPAYTKLPEKTIENTRVVSAIENTRLDLTMRTNKPVKSARLVDGDGHAVPLTVDAQNNRLYAAAMTLDKSRRYKLELVDEQGRGARPADELDIKVFPNKPPEIKVRFPVADARVTPLEEMRFEADVTDDFGLSDTGLTYAVAGKAPRTFDIPPTGAAQTRQRVTQMLKLEDERVKANDLVTWYFWAEDLGPDGAPRRTQSDVHFATVRHFEEIFRPGQGSGEGGQGNPGQKLIEIQKQIIQATWNVRRQEKGPRPSGDFSKNTPVLKKSQEVSIDLTKAAEQIMPQPEARAILAEAQKHMTQAVTHLGDAGTQNSIEKLAPALDAENAAYRALLKLIGREWQVVQSQPRAGSPQQQELQDLDLKRNADRYETERQASAEMTGAQKEELQILSRLRELAQRQQDLNEKLKELQIALQTAKTPEERAEIERELKRLREKQQEMLADIDQLNQRMSDPDKRSGQRADTRQRMENTREAARKAAEELEKNNPGNALAAGSRAERELEKLRDDFRRQTSGEFSEQMRNMRTEARELAQKQEDLGEKLAEGQRTPRENERRSLRGGSGDQALTDEINKQGERLSRLLENMRAVTEASENSEPILSRKLLDAARKTDHAGVQNALARAAELAGQSAKSEAAEAANHAGRGVAELKRDVEAAAESVLGNKLDALRFAKGELAELGRQIEKEIASAQGERTAANSQGDPEAQQSRQPGRGEQQPQGKPEGGQRGQQEQPGQGEQQGSQPGEQGQRGENGLQGKPDQQGPQSGQEKSGSGDETGPNSISAQQGRPRNGSPQGAGVPPRDDPRATGGGGESGRRESNGGPHEDGIFGGGDFLTWSDRLRNVEEIVEQPELRDALVKAREAAREIRTGARRHAQTPQWDLVRSRIAAPLAETEARLAEELARLGSKDPLAPVERDPVPDRYAEVVRKYYEQLGK